MLTQTDCGLGWPRLDGAESFHRISEKVHQLSWIGRLTPSIGGIFASEHEAHTHFDSFRIALR